MCHGGQSTDASALRLASSLFRRCLQRVRKRVPAGWTTDAPVGDRSGRRVPISLARRNDPNRADRSEGGDMGCARRARDRPVAVAANQPSGRDGCRHSRSACRQRQRACLPSSLASGSAAPVAGAASARCPQRMQGGSHWRRATAARQRALGLPIAGRVACLHWRVT